MSYVTQILRPVVSVYVQVPLDGKFSERTPFWAIALYGVVCIVTLVLMYMLILKTRREKKRRSHSARTR